VRVEELHNLLPTKEPQAPGSNMTLPLNRTYDTVSLWGGGLQEQPARKETGFLPMTSIEDIGRHVLKFEEAP
jgi:hypothetical protein